MKKCTVAAAAALLCLSVTARAEVTPKTDDEKTLYAIGVAISRNLIPFELSPAELELVQAGITGGVTGKAKVAEDGDESGSKIGEFLEARMKKGAEKEKKEAQSFLDKAAAEKGAKKLPSGLIYTEVKAGDGKAPTANDQVKVHYKGTLRDGTVFDSSIERGEPAQFPVHGVIPCWVEALQLMKEHGKAKLTCPSELAYGDQGAPPKIKPGAPLVFEVELLEVSAGKAEAPADDPHSPHGK